MSCPVLSWLSAGQEGSEFTASTVPIRYGAVGLAVSPALPETGSAGCPDVGAIECGAEDTVRHLLTECHAFASTRRRLWGGPVPSLDDVLSGPADKILDYIRRVGRSEPPLDQPPPDAPAGASA